MEKGYFLTQNLHYINDERLIYESLCKYLEAMSDGTRHADLDKLYADWGLLEDDLMAPLRYCAIAKSWNSGISPGTMAGDSFIKRFLEVKPIFSRSNGLHMPFRVV